MIHTLLSPMAREGPRGRRQRKEETVRWCKFSHLLSHHSKQVCPKGYLLSVEWVTRQYFPWFKARLMWQRFKSNRFNPVLTGEIKKWVEMSFPLRIQFHSTPWTDKIPKSQKWVSRLLKKLRKFFRGTWLGTKKYSHNCANLNSFMCQSPFPPGEWRSSERERYHQHAHSCSHEAPVHWRVSSGHPGTRQPCIQTVLDLTHYSLPNWYQPIYSANAAIYGRLRQMVLTQLSKKHTTLIFTKCFLWVPSQSKHYLFLQETKLWERRRELSP